MERLLYNKICIITGAAQGIGKGIAEQFAAPSSTDVLRCIGCRSREERFYGYFQG